MKEKAIKGAIAMAILFVVAAAAFGIYKLATRDIFDQAEQIRAANHVCQDHEGVAEFDGNTDDKYEGGPDAQPPAVRCKDGWFQQLYENDDPDWNGE